MYKRICDVMSKVYVILSVRRIYTKSNTIDIVLQTIYTVYKRIYIVLNKIYTALNKI